MLRYACAMADIDYEFEMNSREIIRYYLQQPKGHRRPYKNNGHNNTRAALAKLINR